jgi:hypothetical protein
MSKIEMYAPVLIAGTTGTGKSSTLRNVKDPSRVVILNIERKVLPTRNAFKFKNIDITTYDQLLAKLKQAMESDKYDVIFIDSFTALGDLLYRYCDGKYNGYDVWSNYNNLIYAFMQSIKANVKPLFLTAIPETLEVGFDQKHYVRVKGKEWKYGGVEKEFAIVAYTHTYMGDDGMEFKLTLTPNEMNAAKAPEGMFEGEIDNDINLLIEAQEAYYGG